MARLLQKENQFFIPKKIKNSIFITSFKIKRRVNYGSGEIYCQI